MTTQRILLVGGSSDIGLAVVRAFAETGGAAGGQVALAGRPSPRLRAAAAELSRTGWGVDVLDYEATAPPEPDALLKAADEAMGGLDTVVLAVGRLTGPLDPSTDGAWRLLADDLAVNLTAPVVLLMAAVERLSTHGGGQVIVLSSASALRPRSSILIYGVAKQGLDRVALELAAAHPRTGVRVHIVRPGHVSTRMTRGLPIPPLSRTVEDVAAAVVSGVRSGRTVIWVPPAMAGVMAVLRRTPRAALPPGLR